MKTQEENHKKAVKIASKTNNLSTAIRNCKQDKELEAIVTKIFSRADKTEISVKKWIENRLTAKLQQIADAMPSTGYSMGEKITVKCNKLTAVSDRRKRYANSCKYSPTWGYYDYTIQPSDLNKIEVIGGVVTFIYPNQKSKVKKCYWLASEGQKSNFKLQKIEGFVCFGYHGIDKKTTKERGTAVFNHINTREIAKKKQEKRYNQALKNLYTYQDSIDCGNCEVGSKAFILRCSLDSHKKYRGSYLLKLATEKSTSSISYVKKMIEYKSN